MLGFLDDVKYVTRRLKIALPENKRELVSVFCENLEWKDGKARWDWTKPYFILAKQPKSSTVLRIPRINRTDCFDCNIKTFQNPVWTEQARERLKQIHTLTQAATI